MTTKKIIKSITLISLCSLILLSIGSSAEARPYLKMVESTLEISADHLTFEDVEPETDTVTSTITVRYDYEKGSLPLGIIFKNQKTPTSINLTITSKPSWCTVSLAETQFTANISSFFQPGNASFTTTLIAKVTSDAPAFEKGTITLRANAAQNNNINAANASLDFTITPDFLAGIKVSVTETELSFEPGEQKMIALQVTNLANGPIIASLNYSSDKSNNNLTVILPDSKTIDINGKDFFLISLKSLSPEKTITDQIVFTLSHTSSEDTSLSGDNVLLPFSITLISEKEEFSMIDLAPYIIGIAAVCILVIIIFSVISWRRKSNY